jgi:hypothetical protein
VVVKNGLIFLSSTFTVELEQPRNNTRQ